MDLDKNPDCQIESPAHTLSPAVRASISAKLESTWELYIDAIHQFIKLNIYLIVGLAVFVSFLPQLRGTGNKVVIESKGLLFGGFLLLMLSLLCEVALRIWAQMFMEYEVMQPPEDVMKYFGDRPHFTWSYSLAKIHYKWQAAVMRTMTAVAPLCFLIGLGLSLVFIYRNLK
jgi:hypothetical protein